MAKLKRKTTTVIEPQIFQIGETCAVLRPHLWSSCVGTVTGFKDGMHRLEINANKDGSTTAKFFVDVPGSQLEGWI